MNSTYIASSNTTFQGPTYDQLRQVLLQVGFVVGEDEISRLLITLWERPGHLIGELTLSEANEDEVLELLLERRRTRLERRVRMNQGVETEAALC